MKTYNLFRIIMSLFIGHSLIIQTLPLNMVPNNPINVYANELFNELLFISKYISIPWIMHFLLIHYLLERIERIYYYFFIIIILIIIIPLIFGAFFFYSYFFGNN